MVFNSKLLLFGEYAVLCDSPALAIPYPAYYGEWISGSDLSSPGYTSRLLSFADYLDTLAIGFNTQAMRKDIADGWRFQSNIPSGYGLGSSGALCAALYHQYVKEPVQELTDLQSVFSRMEGFFHGSSSGLDPLVSYVQKGVLIQGQKEYRTVDVPLRLSGKESRLFLYDSGLPRQTKPLVDHFLSAIEHPSFRSLITETLSLYNQQAIAAVMAGDNTELLSAMQCISDFQWMYFQRMIPAALHEYWKRGLTTGDYYMKLCGAGGGGYFIVVLNEGRDMPLWLR